jgi:hypothetical protein
MWAISSLESTIADLALLKNRFKDSQVLDLPTKIQESVLSAHKQHAAHTLH